MRVGLRLYLTGATMLVVLAGCGRGMIQFAERAPWRHDAEVACMRSGEVKLGTGVVRIEPIEGPGVCGADFPLKVSVLGEGGKLAYTDDLRPPASIPNSGYDSRMPRWPASQPRYAPPPVESQPLDAAPGAKSPHRPADPTRQHALGARTGGRRTFASERRADVDQSAGPRRGCR